MDNLSPDTKVAGTMTMQETTIWLDAAQTVGIRHVGGAIEFIV